MLIHSLARNAGLAAAPPMTGSRSGLCAGTRVMTLDGHVPVEFLTPGDCVITRNGSRELLAVHRHWLHENPVRIKKGCFGTSRPANDLMLGPDQTLHFRSEQGEDPAGFNESVVAAHRMIDDIGLVWAELAEGMLVFQLEFDDYYTFFAEGMEVVSHLPSLAPPAFAAE